MRLGTGGEIDRSRTLRFTFDGQAMTGHPGDTLASALIANGVRLMGRSFKYHRPRGVMTAGSEEPNALMQIGTGAARRPNTRATVQELYDGLVAESQNRWPSLTRDILAVNDLFAPFLGAGFYYKTFMWPKAFWERVYEPAIRRAAGLGALSGEPDPGTHEKAWAHCDVLVIGSGPAGLMAALTAGHAGARVILAEEDALPGGRLNSDPQEVGGVSGADWAARTVAELRQMPNVRILTRTSVIGAYDGGTYGALERVGDHHAALPDGAPQTTFWRIVAGQAVLAAGATERGIAFPDNDRPGIMLSSAVRTYLTRFAAAPAPRIAVLTANDDGWRTARAIEAAGLRAVLIEAREGVTPDFDGETVRGRVTATEGRLGLRAIEAGGRKLYVDALAVAGGWNPNVHLTCHMGGRPVWREDIAAFVPAPNAVSGLHPAGAANGAFSTHAALAEGRAAAEAALTALGITRAAPDLPAAEDAPTAITPLWLVEGKGRAWVDHQNDVTAKDIAQAAKENYRSVEHMKRYTTLGMATDQGKTANVPGLALLAEATGRGIAETGTTTFRPPYTPVPIASFAGAARGKSFQPERWPPSADLSTERGAPTVEAGLWHRASYYPAPGETTWRQSCDREVRMVRESVGICDVTTLGKIDIQGPDAAAFLDRLYTGTFSTLKEGRVRYGIMLREDGFVMDDGTTARMGPEHFVMTTTTGAASEVMSHLDFCHQVLWPDLSVRFVSTTEQWAQFAVAGPKSRELLDALIEEPVDAETYPFMACGRVTIGGVAGRLFRISFSGEHAYEVAVSTRYGDALVRELVRRAEAMGGGLYGMEALNVLRIEKGLLTHAELHGRTTARDLGLHRMVSTKKDFIGRAMALRPALTGPGREMLVGLRPVSTSARLLAGAHLFAEGESTGPGTDQGYLTSVCYSPTLGTAIGLGFLRDGPDRVGEKIRAVDLLRDEDVLCEVVPTAFVDPEGERLRG
ncbi:MAG: sarcosine oxidase subunit alpha family protein [Pseudomonadota bacterium]